MPHLRPMVSHHMIDYDGIFLLIEATRQLRGECDERQVEGARIALAHGTGGVLSSGATVLLGKD